MNMMNYKSKGQVSLHTFVGFFVYEMIVIFEHERKNIFIFIINTCYNIYNRNIIKQNYFLKIT